MDPAQPSDRLEALLAHRSWVRRVARALVLDQSRADDLEQEVWLDALRAPRPRSPKAWLGTVARRIASNMRRDEGRRGAREGSAPERTPQPDPAEWIERAEVIERVARAVRTLEEPYRTAIFLRYFEDLPPPAIAARLGIPLETVRTRLRRALVLLRERLDGEDHRWSLLLLPFTRDTGSVVGGTLMTLKAKAAVVAAVLLLATGGLWWTRPESPPAAVPGGPPAAGAIPVAVAVRPGPKVTAPTPRPEAPARPGTKAVGGATAVGRIVDDGTGEPVPGARVRAVFQSARTGEEEKEPRAVTDREGRYRLEGIDQHYLYADSLLVEAEGYAEAVGDIYGWGLKATAGSPADLGEVRLERGAAVSGRVLAADGRPVEEAKVLFCRDTVPSFPPTFQPGRSKEMGTTDAEGRYSLVRVPSARGEFRHTLFAVAGGRLGWLALPSVAGRRDLADQDIRLAPTASLEVTVRGPDGAPVVGARVSALPHFPPLGAELRSEPVRDLWFGREDLKAVFEGITGSEGSIRFPRLPMDGDSCRYDVVARAGGFALGFRDGVGMAPGEGREVVVDLVPFLSPVIAGTVRDPEGVVVAGAEVNFIGHRSRTDAEGAYRVEGIDPGTVTYDPWMTVEAPGFATASRVCKRPGVWEGGGIDFVLERARPVKGLVVDESGGPVPGTQVTLQVDNLGIETGHSGEDGRFALKAGAGRNGMLSIYPPPPATDWLVPELVKVPADGGEVVVVLKRAPTGATVVVEVLDAASGQPLDPTKAEACPVDWRTLPRVYGTAPRLESGRVVFERVLPGDWVLWIATAGRPPARTVVRVEPGLAEVRTRVQCPAAGTVQGRIEGAGMIRVVYLSIVGITSKPQWVRLNADPNYLDAVGVEPDGTFRVADLPPGPLRLWTEGEGCRGETEVEVPAGAEVEAVIRLVAQGRARFRPAGIPPKAAVLVRYAAGLGEWSRWSYFATADGSIPSWTTNVPPGRVRWQARFADRSDGAVPDGPPSAEGEFEAKAGETVEVPIPVR